MEYRVSRLETDKLKALRAKNIPKQEKEDQEDQQERKKLTRIALQLIVSADKLLSEQRYSMAKKPLIFAADTLLSIQNPNNTVKTLTTVCFDYIAHAAEKQQEKRTRVMELTEQYVHKKANTQQVMKVQFSKDKGVFVFDSEDKRTAPPHIKFYVCKLNSILFAYNNMKAQNSLFAMLRIYSLPIILIFFLICFLLIIAFSTLMKTQGADLDSKQYFTVQHLPVIISSILFLIPLMLIYFKRPQVHNYSFFQMKLGQEIQAVNQDCEARRLNIKFQLGTVASTSNKQMGYALNIILPQRNSSNLQGDSSSRMLKSHRKINKQK